jgi:hypothetical protein
MAISPEKLAQSLEILRNLQTAEGAGAIRARDLSRTHRERLLRNGFLQEVIKGWYIPSRPDEVKGESTAWYASFWRFCAVYLEARWVAGTIPCVQAFVELLAKFAPPENARHELGSSHRHDRKRRRGAKA